MVPLHVLPLLWSIRGCSYSRVKVHVLIRSDTCTATDNETHGLSNAKR